MPPPIRSQPRPQAPPHTKRTPASPHRRVGPTTRPPSSVRGAARRCRPSVMCPPDQRQRRAMAAAAGVGVPRLKYTWQRWLRDAGVAADDQNRLSKRAGVPMVAAPFNGQAGQCGIPRSARSQSPISPGWRSLPASRPLLHDRAWPGHGTIRKVFMINSWARSLPPRQTRSSSPRFPELLYCAIGRSRTLPGYSGTLTDVVGLVSLITPPR